jgi:hypothetical protein
MLLWNRQTLSVNTSRPHVSFVSEALWTSLWMLGTLLLLAYQSRHNSAWISRIRSQQIGSGSLLWIPWVCSFSLARLTPVWLGHYSRTLEVNSADISALTLYTLGSPFACLSSSLLCSLDAVGLDVANIPGLTWVALDLPPSRYSAVRVLWRDRGFLTIGYI